MKSRWSLNWKWGFADLINYIKNVTRPRKRKSSFLSYLSYICSKCSKKLLWEYLLNEEWCTFKKFYVTWHLPQQVLFKTRMCPFRCNPSKVYAHYMFHWHPLSEVSSSEFTCWPSVGSFSCHSVTGARITSLFLTRLCVVEHRAGSSLCTGTCPCASHESSGALRVGRAGGQECRATGAAACLHPLCRSALCRNRWSLSHCWVLKQRQTEISRLRGGWWMGAG